MALGFEFLFNNIGLGMEWTILLVLIIASLIIASKSFQIFLMVLMISMAGLFIWFYQKDLKWYLPLVVFLMSFVALSLSLYATSKTSTTGGFT